MDMKTIQDLLIQKLESNRFYTNLKHYEDPTGILRKQYERANKMLDDCIDDVKDFFKEYPSITVEENNSSYNAIDSSDNDTKTTTQHNQYKPLPKFVGMDYKRDHSFDYERDGNPRNMTNIIVRQNGLVSIVKPEIKLSSHYSADISNSISYIYPIFTEDKSNKMDLIETSNCNIFRSIEKIQNNDAISYRMKEEKNHLSEQYNYDIGIVYLDQNIKLLSETYKLLLMPGETFDINIMASLLLNRKIYGDIIIVSPFSYLKAYEDAAIGNLELSKCKVYAKFLQDIHRIIYYQNINVLDYINQAWRNN